MWEFSHEIIFFVRVRRNKLLMISEGAKKNKSILDTFKDFFGKGMLNKKI